MIGTAGGASGAVSGDVKTESPGFWVQAGLPRQGVFLHRTTVRIDGTADSLDPLFIRVFPLPRAQEFYWDGERIGSNGRVADTFAEERPGALMATVRIPHRLSGPGEHSLEIRVSNHGWGSGGMEEVRMGTLKALQLSTHVDNAVVVFLAGVFFITAVFQFVNFLSSIRRGYALFSVFCLGCALNILPARFGLYLGADTDDLQGLLLMGLLGWTVMMTALPFSLLSEYSGLSRKAILSLVAGAGGITIALAATVAGIAPPSWINFLFPANAALGFLAVLASLLAAGRGMRLRLPGAGHAAAGLLCLLLGVAGSHAAGSDYPWGLGLAALILFRNISLSGLWQSRNLESQMTQLRASRLEIELLKKNIQPHFLVHSLRSITDLLVSHPKTAARLVNALAGELRMMLKMTHEKLIPLEEEIRLCRSHLEVVGIRGGRVLELVEDRSAGPEGEGHPGIPPMVLHTLLEQGIEETFDPASDIRFRLSVRTGRTIRLRISHGAPVRPPHLLPTDGTGLRYVRARLEEAFPGRWSLSAGRTEAGETWGMEIEIPGDRVPAA